MPDIDVAKKGFNSVDKESVNQNYLIYYELNEEAQKHRFPIPENGVRPEVYDTAFYYDKLLEQLSGVVSESRKMVDDKYTPSYNSLNNYNEANKALLETIDIITESSKNAQSEADRENRFC